MALLIYDVVCLSPDHPKRKRVARDSAMAILSATATHKYRVASSQKHPAEANDLRTEAELLLEACAMLAQQNADNPIADVDLTDPWERAETLRWKARVQECLRH